MLLSAKYASEGSSTGLDQQQIKLVIWDLDDTFWQGTLSEGSVSAIDTNLKWVRELSAHGIVNSICSKNDNTQALSQLERFDIKDLFTFSKISWQPKGPQVKHILEQMGLRAVNTLFIDDNRMNIEEVKHFCPSIQTLMPDTPDFSKVLARVLDSGKPDPELNRLKQYKLLEHKTQDAQQFASNQDFLRQSLIQVNIIEHPIMHLPRIHDLVARANQLNFTKIRETESEIEQDMLKHRTYAVQVTDKYGDYGIVGYVALVNERLKHFVFSCRILHMGIEQYLYRYFKQPEIDILGEVASSLEEPEPVWINLRDGEAQVSLLEKPVNKVKVLFIGGCDLKSSASYLQENLNVDTHFNYQSKQHSRLQIHRDGIEFQHLIGLDDQRVIDNVLETCFFADDRSFQRPDFTQYDVVIYSPLIDFIQARYRHKKFSHLTISFGDLRRPLPHNDSMKIMRERLSIRDKDIETFLNSWHSIPFDYQDYLKKLTAFTEEVTRHAKLILINGANETYSDLDADLIMHHKKMNVILNQISKRKDVFLIDVNNIISKKEDFSNAIRHYSRNIYYRIAMNIVQAIAANADIEQ